MQMYHDLKGCSLLEDKCLRVEVKTVRSGLCMIERVNIVLHCVVTAVLKVNQEIGIVQCIELIMATCQVAQFLLSIYYVGFQFLS